ncbi:MAG: ABC transporter ATP-binding protein [Spirochaetaceae bacterium]|jgi:peptide/nickel transport system ATP-binding protein|nr:ABC transporter ATP-binding protein [Spirochaetaceae bacterium]
MSDMFTDHVVSDVVSRSKIIDIINASRSFQVGNFLHRVELLAVNDITFSLHSEKPEIFTIAGESGSGKTTLSRLVLRDLEPTGGDVFFEGRSVRTIRSKEDFHNFMSKVQPVFQNPFETFNPLRRVEEYLYDTAINFGRAENRKEAAEIVDQALRHVGLSLEEVSKRYPHEMSGGQIQRTSVARALIPNPKLILADEPVSMVDASLRMAIVNLFQKLRDEEGVSIIYITHDLATAYYISDRIAIMLRGEVVEMGPVDKVLGNPLHPYTQLLKESVPQPQPKDKTTWAQRIGLSTQEVKEYSRTGCKFASRCPKASEKCLAENPKARDADGRSVKCHLYA